MEKSKRQSEDSCDTIGALPEKESSGTISFNFIGYSGPLLYHMHPLIFLLNIFNLFVGK